MRAGLHNTATLEHNDVIGAFYSIQFMRNHRPRPAVITLDSVMPGLDGWATLAALNTDEETKSIPVIMVTVQDKKGKAHSLGAADFPPKPIDWGWWRGRCPESLEQHHR